MVSPYCSIVQIVFYFRSFWEIEYILEISEIIIGLKAYCRLLFIYFEAILDLCWSVD